VWKLIGTLVTFHRLVLFLHDLYRFPDLSVHPVAFSVDHLGPVLVYDVVERNGLFVTADLFCSVAADLLMLRVYALTSSSCCCTYSHTPKALCFPHCRFCCSFYMLFCTPIHMHLVAGSEHY